LAAGRSHSVPHFQQFLSHHQSRRCFSIVSVSTNLLEPWHWRRIRDFRWLDLESFPVVPSWNRFLFQPRFRRSSVHINRFWRSFLTICLGLILFTAQDGICEKRVKTLPFWTVFYSDFSVEQAGKHLRVSRQQNWANSRMILVASASATCRSPIFHTPSTVGAHDDPAQKYEHAFYIRVCGWVCSPIPYSCRRFWSIEVTSANEIEKWLLVD
jgi:hypothetical protein